MKEDPIVKDVRAARSAYAEQFGHDIKAIFEDIRKRQSEGGRNIVARAARRPDSKKRVA